MGDNYPFDKIKEYCEITTLYVGENKIKKFLKEKANINKDKPKKVKCMYLKSYLKHLNEKIKKFLKHKVN